MSGLTFKDHNMALHSRGNEEANFQIVRQIASGDPTYIMYASDNAWVIEEYNAANGTHKYIYKKITTQSIAAGWAAIAAHTYVEYNALF